MSRETRKAKREDKKIDRVVKREPDPNKRLQKILKKGK